MEIQPLHTQVEKTIQLTTGILVLESPNGFPRNESNLYLIASSGKILWKGEMPDANAYFMKVRLNEDGETLSAYTVNGHACELDLRSGKLLSHTSIK